MIAFAQSPTATNNDVGSTTTAADLIGTSYIQVYSQTSYVEPVIIDNEKIYKSQWLLRAGPKIKLDPPATPIIKKNHYLNRKVLRCNRKGIGLRIKMLGKIRCER